MIEVLLASTDPEVISQFLEWAKVKHTLSFFLFVILLVVGGLMLSDANKESDWEVMESQAHTFKVVFGILLVVVSVVKICVNIYYIAYIETAPELYLIEFFNE
ncbi:MAG TPA: hypothetical protein VK031_08715 [Tissierellaceae bacterium]|nr:hypothetical protein [Tissierellaceae bacterium]